MWRRQFCLTAELLTREVPVMSPRTPSIATIQLQPDFSPCLMLYQLQLQFPTHSEVCVCMCTEMCLKSQTIWICEPVTSVKLPCLKGKKRIRPCSPAVPLCCFCHDPSEKAGDKNNQGKGAALILRSPGCSGAAVISVSFLSQLLDPALGSSSWHIPRKLHFTCWIAPFSHQRPCKQSCWLWAQLWVCARLLSPLTDGKRCLTLHTLQPPNKKISFVGETVKRVSTSIIKSVFKRCV